MSVTSFVFYDIWIGFAKKLCGFATIIILFTTFTKHNCHNSIFMYKYVL